MCGIAGILRFDRRPVAAGEIHAMNGAMVHRGPDDEGVWVGDGVGLGMRRLSIIDLETGQQPIANEDGTVRVIQNGEIYNYRELRRELEGRGHVFRTESDTEVIVHLYEELGAACVERLRGMFALAIWDAPRRRLLVARDRLGIKPLYFARARGGAGGDTLLFASELKAILAAGVVPVELDWTSVSHLFSFMTTPPDRSIVAGVEKLQPGHLLVASDDGTVTTRRYWEVRFEPDRSRSEGEWVEAIRGALRESVRLHRVSDVPLGAFLSGGVDSSSVVGTLSEESPEPVRTFSIGFAEAEYDELEYARLAARTFGTEHREAVLEPEVLEILDDLSWYLDEPFGDSSAIPTFMVSKLAAEDVKVVLSGDGGDELFAGYDRYLVERRERINRFVPGPLRSVLAAVGERLPEGATGREFLRHLGHVGLDRYVDSTTLFKHDWKRRLFEDEAHALFAGDEPGAVARRYLDTAERHWLSALQHMDLETYLPLDILTKVDRTSMAHSIETRVPLLDHPLVELAARIPPELQLRGRTTKYLFKRALEGLVPREILERPKRGFAIPLGRWFRGRLGPFVRELLLSDTSRRRGIFRTGYLEELLRRHEAGRDLDLELWTLISFELWCRKFLDPATGGVAAAAPALAPDLAPDRAPDRAPRGGQHPPERRERARPEPRPAAIQTFATAAASSGRGGAE